MLTLKSSGSFGTDRTGVGGEGGDSWSDGDACHDGGNEGVSRTSRMDTISSTCVGKTVQWSGYCSGIRSIVFIFVANSDMRRDRVRRRRGSDMLHLLEQDEDTDSLIFFSMIFDMFTHFPPNRLSTHRETLSRGNQP